MRHLDEDMLLTVNDLKVGFRTLSGTAWAVDGLSFAVDRGQILAIVGESGSGKTAATLAILGLHGGSAEIAGSIRLDDTEIVAAAPETMRQLRGNRISMIFQDPLTAMHPYHRVGEQIVEAYRAHDRSRRGVAVARTLETLDRVGIPDPRRCFAAFPHELSGGMRQRAMIAMALVRSPDLIVADEPTTALDVTIQAQILELLDSLRKEFGTAIVLITHDLGVVAEVASGVVVMYAGKAVEMGGVAEVFQRPQHPYTRGLLDSIPRLDRSRNPLRSIPGAPPQIAARPPGCRFHPRCAERNRVANSLCERREPMLARTPAGHAAACHLVSSEVRSAAGDPQPGSGAVR